MLRCVALVRTDVSEELSASIIRATRIGDLGTLVVNASYARCKEMLGISSQHASVASYNYRSSQFTDSCHPDEGGAKFLRNVGSYKSHTA
jgi:hypothetical protein